ncbi:MAG: hypothetical protein KAW47_04915 [Thermoplasmatales archaeon]|nr:hypothetical protein [Thermoplasmatales archaeon]
MNDYERFKYMSRHYDREEEAEYYFKPSACASLAQRSFTYYPGQNNCMEDKIK